ncbi:MAG: sulfotransferase family 2 domain-containing protein [Planctomycetes bacterium]|nr:sulfotransferase family 2 domain-containing protein [Planctomycetota bacterium]
MPNPEPLQIFLHIPKAAGSTLQAIIYNNFRPEEIYWIDPNRIDESLAEFADLSEEAQGRIRLLGGHMGFGVHQLAKRPCKYFTMLREPVARIISMYHYIRTDPQHFLYHEVNAMALQDFVKTGVSAQFANGQTRLLDQSLCGKSIGSLERADYKECTSASLARAKANLRDHFTVIGISENFNASLLLLKQTFGWNRISYSKINVNRKRPAIFNINIETLTAIAEANKFDTELYLYGKELLREKITGEGTKFFFKMMLFKMMQICR